MPVLAAEVQFYKSTQVGSGAVASLGGAITANVITSSLLNDLFDNVTPAEATNGATNYRCIYVQNTNATTILQALELFITTNAPNANVNCAIGLDPAGLNGTATTIANEEAAPAGVAFTEPTSIAPLVVGDLAATEYFPFWIRRVVTPGATASAGDNLVLGFAGATDP